MKMTELGGVYIITNPAWPDHIKVGKAQNIVKRLANYQTYCPDAGYTIAHAWAVPLADLSRAERYAHKAVEVAQHRAEWFQIDPASAILAIDSVLSERFQTGVGFETLLEIHAEAHRMKNRAASKKRWREDPEKEREIQRAKSKRHYWSDPEKNRADTRERVRAHRARKKEEAREKETQTEESRSPEHGEIQSSGNP